MLIDWDKYQIKKIKHLIRFDTAVLMEGGRMETGKEQCSVCCGDYENMNVMLLVILHWQEGKESEMCDYESPAGVRNTSE